MPTNDGSAYDGPAIPRALGEGLRRVLALDDRPRTFGEYVASMASLVERVGLDVDLDALCTTDASPHRATFRGQTRHYHCTLDAVVVPFLADDPDRVDVRTVCPVTDDSLAFAVTDGGVDATPADLWQSFGVATDVRPPPTGELSPALAYRRVCPYAKAFTSRSAYEEWATETEAHTMTVGPKESLELAKALGEAV